MTHKQILILTFVLCELVMDTKYPLWTNVGTVSDALLTFNVSVLLSQQSRLFGTDNS